MLIFIASGMVAWPHTLAMADGALTGGYVGAQLPRVIRPGVIRWIVIIVGATVTAFSARRYWGTG